MKDLLEFIVKSIVSKPEAVKIEESTNEAGDTDLKLTVDASDMGTVIGKEGRIIRSIRSLVRIKAIRLGARVNIELLEPEGGKNFQLIEEAKKEQAEETIEPKKEEVKEEKEVKEKETKKEKKESKKKEK